MIINAVKLIGAQQKYTITSEDQFKLIMAYFTKQTPK
jgi:hypothetical protein